MVINYDVLRFAVMKDKPSLPASVFIVECTPAIRGFLKSYEDAHTGSNERKDLGRAVVDLDDVLEKIEEYNRHCVERGLPYVQPGELLSDAKIVSHLRDGAQTLEELPEIEQIRKRSAERHYQAQVKDTLSILRPAGVRTEDTFANGSLSLGTGVNLITGLFLTFLAGYFLSRYCAGASQTVSLVWGIGVSFCCVMVEVGLLILYDRSLATKRACKSKCPRPKVYCFGPKKDVTQNDQGLQGSETSKLLEKSKKEVTCRRRVVDPQKCKETGTRS